MASFTIYSDAEFSTPKYLSYLIEIFDNIPAAAEITKGSGYSAETTGKLPPTCTASPSIDQATVGRIRRYILGDSSFFLFFQTIELFSLQLRLSPLCVRPSASFCPSSNLISLSPLALFLF